MSFTVSDAVLARLEKLKDKLDKEGQNLELYLDHLYESDYVNYWDYINLDALLSLQHPRTKYPDEKTFIIYHQITELYFRLIRNCIELIADEKNLSAEFFIKQMKRVNNYFRHLTDSFSIMYEGMDREQFLAFRLALMPASGFQSAQYRMIEIYSTDIHQLVSDSKRNELKTETDIEKLYAHLYWKQGATELETGKKTLTLRQFEDKYDSGFLLSIDKWKSKNLFRKYESLSAEGLNNSELKNVLREYDQLANINWNLIHYRTAARYMERKPTDIAATGGTNWQKYLPPRFQRIIFFPQLWTDDEMKNWGSN
ncbi:MAG TPA: tryptophan 2,3-dioxygenase [Bacteroidetes bacterium]|nr:tryptophan 2,3-dioxygenase [Bacteroidota bacterium]